jgi:hypothetical protein
MKLTFRIFLVLFLVFPLLLPALGITYGDSNLGLSGSRTKTPDSTNLPFRVEVSEDVECGDFGEHCQMGVINYIYRSVVTEMPDKMSINTEDLINVNGHKIQKEGLKVLKTFLLGNKLYDYSSKGNMVNAKWSKYNISSLLLSPWNESFGEQGEVVDEVKNIKYEQFDIAKATYHMDGKGLSRLLVVRLYAKRANQYILLSGPVMSSEMREKTLLPLFAKCILQNKTNERDQFECVSSEIKKNNLIQQMIEVKANSLLKVFALRDS